MPPRRPPPPRDARAEAPSPPRARAALLLPGLLVVAAAIFFAWRPQLDFGFRFEDLPRVRAAQAGPSLERVRKAALGFFHGEGSEPRWQPGVHALADVVGASAGLEPKGWFAAALVLHGVLTLALFLLLIGEGAGTWFAAAGALAFGLAPACAGVVAAPTAALVVLPSLLLVLWSGRALLQWLQGARGAWLFAALLLLGYALAFDAGGTVVPLLVVGGVVVLGPSRERGPVAALVALLLLAAPVAGLLLFGERGAGSQLPLQAFVPRVVPGLHAAQSGVGELAGLGAEAPVWSVAAAGVVWLGLLVSGSARTRFFLAWALLALLVPIPQRVRPGAPPWTLSVLLPLVVGVVLWCEDRVRGRGRVARVVALAPLLAAVAYAAWRLPPAQSAARDLGEQARGALESLRSDDLKGVIALAVDGAPPRMADGLGAMVAQSVPSAGGATPVVVDLGLVRRPPLLLHLGPEFGASDTGVACFRWNPAARRLVRTGASELIGGLTPQPRFSLRFEVALAADRTAAVQRLAANPRDLFSRVILEAPPAPPFTPTSGARGTVVLLTDPGRELVELEVDAPVEGFLVLHEDLSGEGAAEVATTPATAWIDGGSAALVRADGSYLALRVPRGRHLVQIARAH